MKMVIHLWKDNRVYSEKRNGLIDGGKKQINLIFPKPLTLAECFQYRGDNVFPTDLINPQIAKSRKMKIMEHL